MSLKACGLKNSGGGRRQIHGYKLPDVTLNSAKLAQVMEKSDKKFAQLLMEQAYFFGADLLLWSKPMSRNSTSMKQVYLCGAGLL